MYDTQAVGLLGLNAALAAAAVAGDQLLGHLWWIALIGLLVSSVLAGFGLFIRAEEVGLDLTFNIANAERATADEMDQGIVVALSEAIDENDEKITARATRSWWRWWC
jgi:hypothetical protein